MNEEFSSDPAALWPTTGWPWRRAAPATSMAPGMPRLPRGCVRRLSPDYDPTLRADLDRLVTQALIPERSRNRAPAREPQDAVSAFETEWELIKSSGVGSDRPTPLTCLASLPVLGDPHVDR